MTSTQGKIAPHEGREVAMLLSGDKQIISIDREKDSEAFQRVLVLEKVGFVKYIYEDTTEGNVIAATRPENVSLLYKYKQLQADCASGKLSLTKYHWAVGKMFGYSDEDIRSYINSEFDCNCSRCRPDLHVDKDAVPPTVAE